MLFGHGQGALSRPSWARGLKHLKIALGFRHQTSRPSWARGLKLTIRGMGKRGIQSRPSWARGLKHYLMRCGDGGDDVASLVGAWIETRLVAVGRSDKIMSRPSWARGLKR